MITPKTIISVATGENTFAKMEGEMVIMGVNSGRYFSLNAVGARFWEIIQQPASIEQAAAVITAEFDVTRSVAEQDLAELAEQLVQAGLATTAVS